MQCQFCNNVFSNKQNLNAHQKKAKYCLKIQGKAPDIEYKCLECSKTFTIKSNFIQHQKVCKRPKNVQEYKEQLEKYKEQIRKSQEKTISLEERCKTLSEQLRQIQESYKNLATTSILNDKDKIVKLTKKYVRKRPRQQFDERNVVYIITTPSLKKERRYILGKATNLTNRLSTYNKTDEHEVVFYKSCNSKEMMSCIENMIFNKLSRYREQANRERFILPENQEISLFYNTIEECINFFS